MLTESDTSTAPISTPLPVASGYIYVPSPQETGTD
jgi:hypothetical protein